MATKDVIELRKHRPVNHYVGMSSTFCYYYHLFNSITKCKCNSDLWWVPCIVTTPCVCIRGAYSTIKSQSVVVEEAVYSFQRPKEWDQLSLRAFNIKSHEYHLLPLQCPRFR